MKRLLQQSQLRHALRQRNSYLYFAAGSILCNVLLILYLFTLLGSEKTILVPPEINKTIWVSSNNVSPEYLSEMAVFFTSMRLNMTPSNAAFQRDLLLRYVRPQNYSIIASQLQKEEERIKSGHITLSFFPTDVTVDSKQKIVRVSGESQSMVGIESSQKCRAIYQLSFIYENGRLLIQSFEEVKDNV